MPRLTFFIGKGGVGKTTLSASFAVRLAKQSKKKVLLVSTDPAHSVADILSMKLGSRIKRVPLSRGNLSAWQIPAESVFRKFVDSRKDQILALVESGTLFSAAEVEPLLDTALPGMSELGSLLALQELVEDDRWTDVIIDTAPIGHTLRLFSLPQLFRDFLQFLDLAGSRDRWLTQRFGTKQRSPVDSMLEELRSAAELMESVLSSERSTIYLVTSPETFSLEQSVRSIEALQDVTDSLPIAGIILNRAVRSGSWCANCKIRAERTRAAAGFLEKHFPNTKVLLSEDPGQPILGTGLLARHAETVFGKKRHTAPRPARHISPPLVRERRWPELRQRLCFTLGKGGVGKTTVSASIAYLVREKEECPVTICSTDPAPSLDDIFQTPIGNEPRSVLGDAGLLAIEVDSVAEFRAWADAMQQKIEGAFSQQRGGLTVDISFDRQIFSALLDIVPPGVDEIFAIFKILDLATTGDQRIVIDMAPTGHAVELLRMPERIAQWTRLLLKMLASHRTLALAQDVAVEIASIGQRVRALLALMQDERRACAVAVTLAEAMPVRQAEYLLDQMRELGIEVSALMINRVLLESGCGRCSSTQRWQQKVVNRLARRQGRNRLPVYLLSEQPHEVAGRAALKRFTSKLQQLK